MTMCALTAESGEWISITTCTIGSVVTRMNQFLPTNATRCWRLSGLPLSVNSSGSRGATFLASWAQRATNLHFGEYEGSEGGSEQTMLRSLLSHRVLGRAFHSARGPVADE